MSQHHNIASKQRRRALARLIETQGNVCWICDELIDLDLPRDHLEAATMDHVVPRSRGGSNEITNLRLAHRCCNESRRNARAVA